MYTNDNAIMAHSQIKSIYPNGVNGQYIHVHIQCTYQKAKFYLELRWKINKTKLSSTNNILILGRSKDCLQTKNINK